jgi:hypothetical protein
VGSRAFARMTAATNRGVPRRIRDPETSPAAFVLGLHSNVGNRVVARALLQRKEDWDFTPKEHAALVKRKKDLSFGADSAWFPKALQDNLLATLQFALTAKEPARTAGVNVRDFYHGHFGIPKGKMTAELTKALAEFKTTSEELQAEARGGDSKPVTKGNLAAYTKAMQATEKLATPILEAALKIEGAAVVYHTFESGGRGLKDGSPIRNIRTLIGGTPAGYDPSGTEKSAAQWEDEYDEVLQFAFLADQAGVVHVTVGTTINLSRVTGTPLDL